MTNIRTHRLQPEIVTGYELSPAKSFWSLLVPEATINLFPNGSFENGILGPDGRAVSTVTSNATIVRDNSFQTHGLWSYKVTPSALPAYGGFLIDASYLNTRLGLLPNVSYTWALDLYAPGGGSFSIETPSSGGTSPILSFVASGGIDRVALTFNFPGGYNGNANWIIRKTAGSLTPFWFDAWQLEAKSHATFFCDGDQPGCVWLGSPYVQDTLAQRIAYDPDRTVAPGNLINFKDLGLHVLAQTNTGLPDPQNLTVARGLLGGARYQRTTSKSHILILQCSIDAAQGVNNPMKELEHQRELLTTYFAPDALSQNAAPVGLRYQLLDAQGKAIGKFLDMPCYYLSGLAGNTDNLYSEKIPLSFIRYTSPALQEIYDTALSATLTTTTAAAPSSVINRLAGGTLQFYPDAGGLNNIPPANTFVIQTAPSLKNGSAYLAGSAGAIGVPGMVENGIPNQFVLLSILSGNIYAVSRNNTETPYIGGDFVARTTGVPNFGLATLPASVPVSQVGSAAPNGTVWAILDDNAGNIYIAGDFTTVGGVTVNRIAKYNIAGNTWTALGTAAGLDATGRALAMDQQGNIYIGGDFTTVDGVTSQGFAKYNPTTNTFSVLSATTTGSVYTLVVGPNNLVYLGGTVTLIGGVTVANVASFNGFSFAALGNGLNGRVNSLAMDSFSVLYAAGQFTASGSVTLVSKMAKFAGGLWTSLPLKITGAPNLNAIAVLPSATRDTSFSVGYSSNNNTVVSEGLTTITYGGSAGVRPKIIIRGPGMLYQISNLTSGKNLYFNYLLTAGEIATLDLTPDNIEFNSNYQGNIVGKVLNNSDIVDFGLIPGSNTLSCFMTGTTANSAIEFYWKNAHWSFDASAY